MPPIGSCIDYVVNIARPTYAQRHSVMGIDSSSKGVVRAEIQCWKEVQGTAKDPPVARERKMLSESGKEERQVSQCVSGQDCWASISQSRKYILGIRR